MGEKAREGKVLWQQKLITRTPLYSPLDIEYQQEYSGPYEDLSYYGNDAIIIAAIKGARITGFGRPVVAFGEGKALRREMQRLCDISPFIWFQDYLEGGGISAASKFLLQKGAAAEPFFSQIIDLTKSTIELRAQLRKSYKSLVNKANILIEQDKIDGYRQLHREVFGDVRSDQTYQIQQDMLARKQGFVIINKACSAAGFFIHNNHTCYYASGPSRLLQHPIIWRAMVYAKSLGCKTLEMGEQVFCGEPKPVNISKFKRGFGGRTQTYLHIHSIQGKETANEALR